MPHVVLGILAHVDAGKTTLGEALLYRAGATRSMGRVDKGSSVLDTQDMERRRGITISAKQARLIWHDLRLTLLDTPGHADLVAEAERVLPALDYALLLIAAPDGVTAHAETLWRLLERYNVPTMVFVSKTDLAGADLNASLDDLQNRLSHACLSCADLASPDLHENAAAEDELALDEYLEQGELSRTTLQRLVKQRKLYPVFSGSALRLQGIDELLDGIEALVSEPVWPSDFSGRVFKVGHDERGTRLTWLKVEGGSLRVKAQLEGQTHRVLVGPQGAKASQATWTEKVDQLRVYSGAKYELADEVPAGEVCAAVGLSQVFPGDVLGAGQSSPKPLLAPVMSCSVLLGEHDVNAVFSACRELAEEDPLLSVVWNERLQEIQVQLMGEVQLEVVRDTLRERYGLNVDFGPGGIAYRETINASVLGVGHFEPLRHYAEAHLRIEPLPRGSGVVLGTCASTDDLALNWQRLVLTNAGEREQVGPLLGAPIDDVRITLTCGRAHPKHTEGGDFRQATWRAIRQGLMQAREQDACVLLEPWYRFSLEVPAELVGRAMADVQRMSGAFEPPVSRGDACVLVGEAPVSEMQGYAQDVVAYSRGEGRLSCEFAGYRECHDAERVIAEAAYDPEADLPNTPDSVFCSHGAGYTVKWYDVPEHAHVRDEDMRVTPWREATPEFFEA